MNKNNFLGYLMLLSKLVDDKETKQVIILFIDKCKRNKRYYNSIIKDVFGYNYYEDLIMDGDTDC